MIKYNINRLKKIGSGCTCNAYKKNNRVIKTVYNSDDTKNYQYFMNKKTKHIVRIYNMYKDVVDTHHVDVVVTDLANIRKHKMFYYKLYCDTNREIKNILSNIHKTKSLVKHKTDDKNFNAFIDDLISLVTELHSHNMYCEDIHSENIGYIGKRLVLFDLGCIHCFKSKTMYKMKYLFNSFTDKYMNYIFAFVVLCFLAELTFVIYNLFLK